MRKRRPVERLFLGMAGAYVVFVSPRALADAIMVLRESGFGGFVHLAIALCLILVGFLFLYMAVRGRAPNWPMRSRA